MLQDADCTAHFSVQWFPVSLGSLVLASGMLLTACAGGVGDGEARMVSAGYDTREAEAESEFARLQREILGDAVGDAVGDGLASASLDDFAGTLDNYLEEKKPGNELVFNERDLPDARRASASFGAGGERPKVEWQRPTESPQLTPADRAELSGSTREVIPQSISRAESGGSASAVDAESAKALLSVEGGGSARRTVKGFSLEEMVVMLSSKLHQNAGHSNMPLREYMVDAAMLMLDPARRIDVEELYGLNKREREMLSDLQDFFIDVGKQLQETPDAETIIEAVSKLALGLGSVGNLEIPTFRLCTAVQNFGTYEEIESTTFVRGRTHEVITYVEVTNFKPRALADGRYKTTLTQETELYTAADGTLAHGQAKVTATDYCRNIRRDFFLVRHFTLPANLSVGTYYLKVRVTDEVTKQEAEAVIPLEIVASKNSR